MKLESLHDLLISCLKDAYSSESQILNKGLPAMIKASEGELKEGFEQHLEQTKTHVERLEKIAEMLDFQLGGKKCHGMEGIIAEGEEDINLKPEGSVAIAALTGSAQKVEHYEIASYEAMILLCEKMGHDEIKEILEETLGEEQETSEKLTEIAESDVDEEDMSSE